MKTNQPTGLEPPEKVSLSLFPNQLRIKPAATRHQNCPVPRSFYVHSVDYLAKFNRGCLWFLTQINRFVSKTPVQIYIQAPERSTKGKHDERLHWVSEDGATLALGQRRGQCSGSLSEPGTRLGSWPKVNTSSHETVRYENTRAPSSITAGSFKKK